ncbi:pitrilysin family protein [Paenibacillus sp. NAIST15-1]|uniref:M16 family metallopeptidase n=1 Tax=Paenibacillus sp. NAIST15-1 TaxID=1605994 RepID=UPI00086CA70F|nr:pitrilysin family protein [Paenibacillus sp. NAIST15-1]GAV11427.1 Gp2 [Paenibacillus sp. NAIST15-1]
MEKTVLNNGFTIITNKVSTSKLVALEYVVKVGSFYEDEYPIGISHFLEHMMLSGTKKRSNEDINNDIKYFGGYINGGTSFYRTSFDCTIMKEYWREGLEILSDVVWNATLPEDRIDKERNVIKQEIGLLYDDAMIHLRDHIFSGLLKDGKSDKYTVIGTTDSIGAINKQNLDEYMHKFYTPNRTTLFVSGDVDHHEIISFFNDFHIETSNTHIEDLKIEEFRKLDSVTHSFNSKFDRGYFCCSMFAPSKKSECYYTFELIINLLSTGLSSRLYRKLREELGLLYGLGMDHIDLKERGLSIFTAISDPENFSQIKISFLEELNKLKEELVSERELQEVKNSVMYHLYRESETVSNINTKAIEHYFHGNSEDVKTIVDKISGITPNDIMRCAKEFFIESNYMYIEVTPNK